MVPSHSPRSKPASRVDAPEVLQALRGIWEVGGQEVVVEVDQETGELMACTYEGEPMDPCSVITAGVQLRPFNRHFPRSLLPEEEGSGNESGGREGGPLSPDSPRRGNGP